MPRSFLHDDRLIFSFSGLKTAVLYALHGQNATSPEILLDQAGIGDLAASFQEAVVDVLVAKTRQALLGSNLRRLGVGGGVAANQRFRERIAAMAEELGVELFIPPPALCTDNAAMAAIALPKLWAGPGRRPGRRRHRRTRPAGHVRLMHEGTLRHVNGPDRRPRVRRRTGARSAAEAAGLPASSLAERSLLGFQGAGGAAAPALAGRDLSVVNILADATCTQMRQIHPSRLPLAIEETLQNRS